MLVTPSEKYEGYIPLNLPDRQWPGRITKRPPMWVSTDLRDGNQALERPMTVSQKLLLFKRLVSCGFKEIEVAFPAASETDFNFVRKLIDDHEIPEDVWIQVMTPARSDCIIQAFEATRGAKKVLIQLYNSTSSLFREVILGYTEDKLLNLATDHTHIVRQLADKYSGMYDTTFRLVYGVEGFTQSDPDFVVRLCTQVKNAWDACGEMRDPVVFNLAGTVECAPPNHFADQVEYFIRTMPDGHRFIVGVHAHNDRGTAVAATELAMLAGAQRVDGCLFGNGERTGNADLVTLALNLYSQGISPGLDFSNLGTLVELVTQITNLPIHPRHPYSGNLVFTAFSGGHQDGIRKGFLSMAERRAKAGDKPVTWRVPYLPTDPTDFGFTYEVVRVNSQSGKGGIAYVLEKALHLVIPRPMQIEFSKVVQEVCDREERELTPDEISNIFCRTYHFFDPTEIRHTSDHVVVEDLNVPPIKETDDAIYGGTIMLDATHHSLHGQANELVETMVSLMSKHFGCRFTVEDKRTDILPDQGVVTYATLQTHFGNDAPKQWWGIGKAPTAAASELYATISAVNRMLDFTRISASIENKG